jgi:hypothetical protein
MAKGFLGELWRKLTGAALPASSATRDEPPLPADEILTLDGAWEDGALLRLDRVLQNFNTALNATPKTALGKETLPHYFLMLTRLQRQMVKGAMPFAYPKTGTYNYDEANMFFIEHCYVPATALAQLVKKMKNEGNGPIANVFIRAVNAALTQAEPVLKDSLAGDRYVFENGRTAPQKFYLSAYEAGGSFAPVLRLYTPDVRAMRPKAENGPL